MSVTHVSPRLIQYFIEEFFGWQAQTFKCGIAPSTSVIKLIQRIAVEEIWYPY